MYKCPYCNCDLEPCSGGNVLGICPVCREIWSEDFYIDVMNNPCLKCKSTKVKIREYKLSYICLECEEQWLECEEQWIKTHNGLKGLTPEIHAIDFDTLMIAIKEELQAADKEHGPMLEPIEGWYTTLCEITEWQREIFRVSCAKRMYSVYMYAY